MIVKGISAASLVVKVGSRIRFTPGIGSTVVDVYSAQTMDAANAFYAANIGGALTVDLNTQGPPYLVEIGAPDSGSGNPDDDYVDNWTKPPESADRIFKEHPRYKVLGDDFIDDANKYHKSNENTDFDSAVISAAATGQQADALEFLQLIKKGSDYFRTPQTSVQWVRTVGNGYSSAAFANSGEFKVWTTNQLKALGPTPLISAFIDSAVAALAAPAAGYIKGWLKQAVGVTPRGTNRSDITQTWILENWSDLYYAAY